MKRFCFLSSRSRFHLQGQWGVSFLDNAITVIAAIVALTHSPRDNPLRNYDGIPNYLHAPLGDVVDFADYNERVAELAGDLNEQLPLGDPDADIVFDNEGKRRGMEGNLTQAEYILGLVLMNFNLVNTCWLGGKVVARKSVVSSYENANTLDSLGLGQFCVHWLQPKAGSKAS